MKSECAALFPPLLTAQMQEISDLRVSVVHKSYGQVQWGLIRPQRDHILSPT